MMEDMVLSVKNVTKTYRDKRALDQVSIQIKRGEIYGLVGNNGAGKTTLMRLITGQSPMEGGEISLFGENIGEDLEKARSRTGALIEDPGFFGNMTARQNLEYFRIQYGVPGKKIINELLKEVGLEQVGDKKYKNFSLGMKQRLGIALAVMNSPEFIILDEPINGLDPEGIIEVRNTLLRLNEKRNVTVLISSHILAELSNIATCYGFLRRGKLLEQCTTEELMQKCSSYLDLEVTDVEQMTVLLEQELRIKNYQVYPDQHIHIYEGFQQTKEISKLAVLHDIGLLGLNKRMVNLENYYMNLMGGVCND